LPTYVTLLIIGLGNFLNMGMEQFLVFQNAFNKDKVEILSLYTYNVGLVGNNISRGTAIGMMQSVIALLLLCTTNAVSGKVRDEKVF
jgi:multiple sugar transport system permease protein/putative aldouronate transport system permease protein